MVGSADYVQVVLHHDNGISPPQVEQPEIKVTGKRIQVEFFDSLKENTTYSIDFADGIVDNNEGNPLGDYCFRFSTGQNIDSLEVSGAEGVVQVQVHDPDRGGEILFLHNPIC